MGGLVLSADLGALGAGECPCCGSQFGSGVARGFLRGGLDEFAERRDVGLGVGVVGHALVEGVEGVGGLVPRGRGALSACGGVFFRCSGFQTGLELGEGEVGGDRSAGVEDLFPVLVEVAGTAGGVAEEVSGRGAAGFDRDAVGFEVGEEFLGVAGVGDGGADAVLEPVDAGLFPAEALGLVHLCLRGALSGGAVALLELAQAVVGLDLAAGVADADAAAVEFGAAAVFADGGGEDVDVVVRVAHCDPAAAEVVARRGDACGFDDALGDVDPLGIGEVPVLGGCADGAVPDVVGDLLPELAVPEMHRLVQVVGELGEGGVRVPAGVGHTEHCEARDDVRVEVFVVAAGAVEVGEQATGVGTGRFDGGYHAACSFPDVVGSRRAWASRSSRWCSSSRR